MPFQSAGPLPEGEGIKRPALSAVLDALRFGRSVQLVAPPRRGATTLLRQIVEEIGGRALYRAGVEDFRDGQSLWAHLAARANIPFPSMAAPGISGLIDALTANRPVLLVDQAGFAYTRARAFGAAFFDQLDRWVRHGGQVVLAFYTPMAPYAREAGWAGLEALVRKAQQVEISPLSLSETEALLAPIKDTAWRNGWPKDWLQGVHTLASGEPWMLQRFGEAAWIHRPPVHWESLVTAWQESIRREKDRLVLSRMEIRYCDCSQAIGVVDALSEVRFYDPVSLAPLTYCPTCKTPVTAWQRFDGSLDQDALGLDSWLVEEDETRAPVGW